VPKTLDFEEKIMTTHPRGIIGEIADNQGAFAAVFIGFFLLMVGFLAWADALPEPISKTPVPASAPVVEAAPVRPMAPTRIVALSVGVDATIANPDSTDIAVLDQELLAGAVRYPTSALLGVEGTVLLFGHSSSLPVVRNLAYKTFNNIQNLQPGEIISVYSGEVEYRYAVTGVRVADATEDHIELQENGKHLTLVTCNNSFATKTKRFVVTATLVE